MQAINKNLAIYLHSWRCYRGRVEGNHRARSIRMGKDHLLIVFMNPKGIVMVSAGIWTTTKRRSRVFIVVLKAVRNTKRK